MKLDVVSECEVDVRVKLELVSDNDVEELVFVSDADDPVAVTTVVDVDAPGGVVDVDAPGGIGILAPPLPAASVVNATTGTQGPSTVKF